MINELLNSTWAMPIVFPARVGYNVTKNCMENSTKLNLVYFCLYIGSNALFLATDQYSREYKIIKPLAVLMSISGLSLTVGVLCGLAKIIFPLARQTREGFEQYSAQGGR